MLVCEDMTSCTELASRHVVDQITTVLYSNSYYASVFLLSAPLLVKQYME